MGRRRLLCALIALAFVFCPFASGARAKVDATGVIAGAGTSYTLTITNTGDEPIRCWGLGVPTSVTVTGVQGPAGWNVNVAGTGISGVQFPGPGIAPGSSATFSFTTTAPYPAGVASRLVVSATCQAGSYVDAPVTGPAAPTTPPPKSGPKSCKCAKLTAKLDGTLLNKAPRLRPDKHDFGVGFQWFLTCSKGKGKCRAQIRFLPPKILAGTLPKPKQNLHLNIKNVTVTCGPTPCKKSSTGRFQIKMGSREQLNRLFGRTLAYRLVLTCATSLKTIKVTVFVDQQGRLKAHP